MTMPLLPFNFQLAVSEKAASSLGSAPLVPSEATAATTESFAAALEQAVAAQPGTLPTPAAVARPTPEPQQGDTAPFGGHGRKRREDARGRVDNTSTTAAPTIAMDLVAPALLSPISVPSNGQSNATAELSATLPNDVVTLPAVPQRPLTEETLATAIAPPAEMRPQPAFVPLDRPGEIRTLPIEEPILGRPVEKHPVQRDPEALAAEFRNRLTRVIDRMRDDFGYNVEIVEAVRTPARQAALFSQGRTQPGQVVTWTLDSKHLSGNAVDVRIDGGFDNALGFQKLASVAREEGLQTLGPKDPGHIELPGVKTAATAQGVRAPNVRLQSDVQLPAQTPMPQQPAVAQSTQPSGVARVAEVARVADVAPVARVATVAAVAAVATVGSAASSVVGESVTPRVAPMRNQSRVRDNEGQSRNTTTSAAQHVAALRTDVSALTLAAFSGNENSLTSVAESASGDLSAARSVDMSERVAAILDVHSRAQDRPVSSLLLRLEHPELGEDRLRVDLRNNSVGATLDVANSRSAEQLNAHIADLRRALEAQGLETEHLTIRHAAQAAETAARATERDAVRGVPLPPDSSVANALGARDNVTTQRSSTRSSEHNHQQPTPDQRQQRGRKDPQGGR